MVDRLGLLEHTADCDIARRTVQTHAQATKGNVAAKSSEINRGFSSLGDVDREFSPQYRDWHVFLATLVPIRILFCALMLVSRQVV